MRTHLLILCAVAGAAVAQPPPIIVAPTVPPVFRLLAEPAVQKDVALTEKQKAAVDSIRRQLAAPCKSIYLGPFGTVSAEAIRAGRIAATDTFLTKTLSKEQRSRLDQILFQLREKEFGPHMAFAIAARDLGLRPDQLEDVSSLKGLRVEEIAKVVTSGQPYEKIKIAVEATNGDTFEKMTEMLTRTQRARLKELRGRPFQGTLLEASSVERKAVEPKAVETRPVEPKPVTPKPPEPKPVEPKSVKAKVEPIAPTRVQPPARYLATNIGYYDLELSYCMTPAVKEELRLSEVQVKALADAWDTATGGWGLQRGMVPIGWAKVVHEQTKLVFDKQLTKEQRSRVDQIMMQRRAKVGPEAVCTYPAAITALSLSPVQLQQVTSGKHLGEVLTKDLLAKFDKLFGEPFALPLMMDDYLPATARAVVADRTLAPTPPPAPLPVPVPKPGLYDLELKYLDSYFIGKELKLTDKQSGSIARAWLEFPGRKTGGRVRAGREVEAHEYTKKILDEVLNPAQRARFNEMMMQRRASISPEATCTYPPTIAAINLTPIQLLQLSAGQRFTDVLSKDQLAKHLQLFGTRVQLPDILDDYIPDLRTAVTRKPLELPSEPSKWYAEARDFLEIWDRLKLSNEQVKKLRDLAEDEPKIRELIGKELSFDDTPAALNAVSKQYRSVAEEQCWHVLDATQKSMARRIFGRSK